MSLSDLETDERMGLLSASSIEAAMLCVGKLGAEGGLPDTDTSDASEGTVRHTLAELDIDPELIDDRERANSIRRAKEALMESKEKLGLTGRGIVMKEQRLWLKNDKGEPILSGKADHVEIHGDTAFVGDYKMLYGTHTPAPKNPQLLTLALLTVEHYDVSQVHMVLIEPNMRPTYTIGTVNLQTLEVWKKTLTTLAEEVNREDAKRSAGWKQCRFCKALPFCPEARELLEKSLEVNIEEIKDDPAAMAEAFSKAPLHEKYAQAVKSVCRELLKEDPEAVKGPAGFYALRSSGHTTSYDSEAAIKLLREREFKPEELDKLVRIQESKLVDLWVEKTGLSRVKARANLRETLAECLSTKPKAQKIVRVNDNG